MVFTVYLTKSLFKYRESIENKIEKIMTLWNVMETAPGDHTIWIVDEKMLINNASS